MDWAYNLLFKDEDLDLKIQVQFGGWEMRKSKTSKEILGVYSCH